MESDLVDAVAVFPTATRKSFRATSGTFTPCMRKTQEHLLQTIRVRHTHRVFDCLTPSRCSLVPVNHHEQVKTP